MAHEGNDRLVGQETGDKSDIVLQEMNNDKPESELSNNENEDIVYIHGAKFWLICVAIAIVMFLVNLEVPVVITTLVAITDDLQGFDNVGWVVSSYLLGYVGVIVICAKFSDIFGRKLIFLSSIIFFIIFSAACMIAFLFIPKDFPHHGQHTHKSKTLGDMVAKSTLARIDIPGTILVLFATVALTAAFEEAGKRFEWRSAYVITLLTLSGFLWIALAMWERYVTLSNSVREPILPWRFLLNREMMGILLNFVLLGGPTVICMFILPQRFQLVYGTSGLDAGVRLIPFTAVIPLGSIFASILGGKLKIPPVYLLILGSALQVLGFALIGTLPSTLDIPSRIYGFQVLAGWGCGINFSLLFILIPFVNEKRDNATALGAGSQFRFMGGAIVLAVSTSVFNGYVRPRLESQLGISDADTLTQILPTISRELQEEARRILAGGYSNQILALAVSAALQIPATLLMWRKVPLKI
ncbi:putative multidrug resistance protein fnx1 [Xylaria digitata]|nr:putative multidrug resistance protein fnx1 [Xylaria digitata]